MQNYFEGRERTERAAAAHAATARARGIHLELAEHYAALAKQGASRPANLKDDSSVAGCRLTIIERLPPVGRAGHAG
jgi:hypothetical protein